MAQVVECLLSKLNALGSKLSTLQKKKKKKQNNQSKMDKRCGSSGRASALQVGNPCSNPSLTENK
jgi:hypothetical protein